MIRLDDIVFSEEELLELESASKNLPNELYIYDLTDRFTDKNYDYLKYLNHLFVCKDINNCVSDSDIMFSSSNCNWWNVSGNISIGEIPIIYINFKLIPEYIQSIDLYLQHLDNKTIDNCTMCFKNSKDRDQVIDDFIYQYKTKSKSTIIFTGTFCRVTDGWKFYPKFNEYDGEINIILQKYKQNL